MQYQDFVDLLCTAVILQPITTYYFITWLMTSFQSRRCRNKSNTSKTKLWTRRRDQSECSFETYCCLIPANCTSQCVVETDSALSLSWDEVCATQERPQMYTSACAKISNSLSAILFQNAQKCWFLSSTKCSRSCTQIHNKLNKWNSSFNGLRGVILKIWSL